jgi:hypothetical protein
MYYITNAKNQIIAADEEFLNLLSIDDLTQIYTSIANDELNIEFGANSSLLIKTSLMEEVYDINKTKLYSLVGDLYHIELKEVKSLSISDEKQEQDSVDDDIFDDMMSESSVDEAQSYISEDEKIDDNIKSINENDIEISDDELFDLLLDNDENDSALISDIVEETDEIIEIADEDNAEDDIFAIIDEDAKEVAESEVKSSQEELEPIVLDVQTLSKTIGISEDDYKLFLDEYISTAMSLKNDITSDDEEKRNSALTTLSHLSNVLHIPVVNDILAKLENSDDAEFKSLTQELYPTISRLSLDGDLVAEEVAIDQALEPTEEDENKFQSNVATEEVQSDITSGSGHKIDLSDIKPIHFDFSMEEAASDLSLPVDLIEEFVHDFIDQAHEETEKMLTAYDEGDLDRVNKIGHLLKGTSSNLRIVPLADTLYKIQFCENLDELEPLIRDYWGHFLAFENHIKLRTN